MARTILLFLLPAFLIATHWARLEEAGQGEGRFLWIAALALAPALVRPLWARVLVFVVAALVAVRIAFELSILDARPFSGEDFFGPLASRLWRGFEAFFQVALPFDPAERPAMHGAILLAVFGFCAVLALAIATRRPLLASAALIAGAGWPATVLTGRAELERGAIILAATLLLFAGMRALPTLDLRQPVLAGATVVLAAVVLSTSPSVAKGEFVDGWRSWDVSLGDAPSVGVEYVWNANYAGIRFPKEPTTVLSIGADEQTRSYWRATTLDVFGRGRWVERLIGGADPLIDNDLHDLTADPFLPAEAQNRATWRQADVQVEALRDAHLVGAGSPVAYEPGSRDVDYYLGNVAIAREQLTRGDSYTVQSYVPQPTPQQLGRSRAVYPPYLAELYLVLEESVLPPFGAPDRERLLQQRFERNPRLREYAEVYRQARDVVGNPTNPYTAVVALERWFRTAGDFTYDEQPPLRRTRPPLASFVLSTRRGYCQHFAGAMAVMLRQLGIPARVAAGFTSGRYESESGRWLVADRNAHTWVEAWFDGFGWLPFDPTPGRGQLGATYTASSLRFDLDAFRAAAGGALPRGSDLLRGETQGPDRPRGADPGGATAATSRRGGRRGDGTGIVTLVVLIVLGAAALLAAAKLLRRGGRFLTRDPRGLAGACRRDLAAFLADQGVPVPESATPAELGRIVERQFGVHPHALVEALTLARYGPPETARPAAARARRELRGVRKALRTRLSVPRRTRGLLSLRSLGV
jgi:transglutaminase-like putative cysteine protease